jgi:hypothetical protein
MPVQQEIAAGLARLGGDDRGFDKADRPHRPKNLPILPAILDPWTKGLESDQLIEPH